MGSSLEDSETLYRQEMAVSVGKKMREREVNKYRVWREERGARDKMGWGGSGVRRGKVRS